MRRSFQLYMMAILAGVAFVSGCMSPVVCHLPPSITGQPSNQTVSAGEPALFTVAAFGSGALAYQWYKNGIPIPGEISASYQTPVTSVGDSISTFSVSITNAYGKLASNSATLTVNAVVNSNLRYVATNGDDRNSGSLHDPYRTIQKCASTVGTGWTCKVRAGTYPETIIPNSGITIAAYNAETVRIDGSDPVTGWTLYRGAIYKALMLLENGDTNQVFLDDEMMTEARWPNGNDLFNVNWSLAEAGTSRSQIVDSTLPPADWSGAKVHLWSGSDPFGHETGLVTASSPGQLSINVGQTGTCPSICPVAGGFYYLYGALAALDADQEWFYDSVSATLYFQAPGGINPSGLNVRVKRRPYAFDLRGKSGVTIRGIGLFGSSIVTDAKSSNNTIDRMDAKYISHFTNLPTAASDQNGSGFSILNVHLADSGIILDGTGNTVENSTIGFSAGAGIAVVGDNNLVKNNWIHDVDYIGNYASGIDLLGNGNTIEFNSIESVGRQAILMIGVTREDVSYNNLFDGMLLSRDGGEIYACCQQSASGTRIHHNWIHNTHSSIKGPGELQPITGVYIDNGSDGFEIDQNVLWQNQHYNVLINGELNQGLNTNNIHNNTIPDNSPDGTISLRNIHDCTATQVVNNRTLSKVNTSLDDTSCAENSNSSSAPGANEMRNSTQVGCNFSGCSSAGPPAITGTGYLTPCPATNLY